MNKDYFVLKKTILLLFLDFFLSTDREFENLGKFFYYFFRTDFYYFFYQHFFYRYMKFCLLIPFMGSDEASSAASITCTGLFFNGQ